MAAPNRKRGLPELPMRGSGPDCSIFERGLEELRGVAGKILKSCLSQDTIFRWPKWSRERVAGLKVLEGVTEGGVYTDGSRIEGQTAAATITRAIFLGRYATVMDAEMLAIAMGWEIGATVITDSQGAIGKIRKLQTEWPKGWIEETVVRASRVGEKEEKYRHGTGDQTRVQGNLESKGGTRLG